MDVLKKNIRPKDIVTKESLINAFTVDMAVGGSTNTILHLLAFAKAAGIPFTMKDINRISQKTPYIVKLSPASRKHIEDLHIAGGIPAVMKQLKSHLNLEQKTVTGATIGDIVKSAVVEDDSLIRPIAKAHAKTGGLNILFGNLAPGGGVIKGGAVDPEAQVFRGPARVFDGEEAATKAIEGKKFKSGDVIVIRYEGPKGGPGMREMLIPTSLIVGMGLSTKVALITDGRFSGASRGVSVGYISPEAALKGPIAAVKDGDMITIDIPNYKINIELTDKEIKDRLAKLPAFEPKVKTGYLARYAENVGPASEGAVFYKDYLK
jgi:dihydroxy-acid dehydratase